MNQAVDTTCDLTLRVATDFTATAPGVYVKLYSTNQARVVVERQITSALTMYIYGASSDPGEPAVGGILELRTPINPNRFAVGHGTVLLFNYDGVDPVLTSSIQLKVGTNGTFALNGIDQTISALQGGGTIMLGGATLTMTNGIAPGTNNVGTLTIEEMGEAAITAGTSVFDFSSDTNIFDRVVFTGTADLTLAGTLEITAPSGFSEYGTGHYTIFDLAGGTLAGAFSTVTPPDRMTAELDDSSGDVVLILVKKPTGTSILVR